MYQNLRYGQISVSNLGLGTKTIFNLIIWRGLWGRMKWYRRAHVKGEFQRKMKIKFRWSKEEESDYQIKVLSFVLFCSYA